MSPGRFSLTRRLKGSRRFSSLIFPSFPSSLSFDPRSVPDCKCESTEGCTRTLFKSAGFLDTAMRYRLSTCTWDHRRPASFLLRDMGWLMLYPCLVDFILHRELDIDGLLFFLHFAYLMHRWCKIFRVVREE